MSAVPIVRVGDMLVVALQEDIDDESALSLAGEISRQIPGHEAKAVVLDISAAQFVDSFICRVIADIGAICRLLGARVAVVGMRPAVAITLVELGLGLQGVVTALTIDDAMLALADGAGESDSHAQPQAEGVSSGRRS